MASTSIQVRTISGLQSGTGWAGQQPVVIGRSAKVGGDDLGYSGGQLLALAVGGCYYNNLYFAADEQNIEIRSVVLDVSINWTEEPIVSSGITITAKVEANASQEAIEELIQYAGQASTVSNTLRQGTTIELEDVIAVSTSD